jgi:hypothetical protein
MPCKKKKKKKKNCYASKEVYLEASTEKTKYMLLSHYQNAGQNSRPKDSKENFAWFKHFRTTETN